MMIEQLARQADGNPPVQAFLEKAFCDASTLFDPGLARDVEDLTLDLFRDMGCGKEASAVDLLGAGHDCPRGAALNALKEAGYDKLRHLDCEAVESPSHGSAYAQQLTTLAAQLDGSSGRSA